MGRVAHFSQLLFPPPGRAVPDPAATAPTRNAIGARSSWLAEGEPDLASEGAGAEGLEPPAYGFGDRRSTN